MSEVTVREKTDSQRFTMAVQKQYCAEVGHLNVTEHEQGFLQHLFIKCDQTMKSLAQSGKQIAWSNVNLPKLAIDAVNVIRLGLDALVPGHVYPIPYWNDRSKQFDIDLRIGYKGEQYYIQRASMRPIHDIRVELVYTNDKFTVYKKGISCKVEGYDFEVSQPFDRGEVVGGFVYVEYEDERDNALVVMSRKQFDQRMNMAASKQFWGKFYDEMCYKTLVHKAMKIISIDPMKVSAVSLDELEKPVDDSKIANGAELILDKDALNDNGVTPIATKSSMIVEEVMQDPVQVGMEEPGF